MYRNAIPFVNMCITSLAFGFQTQVMYPNIIQEMRDIKQTISKKNET